MTSIPEQYPTKIATGFMLAITELKKAFLLLTKIIEVLSVTKCKIACNCTDYMNPWSCCVASVVFTTLLQHHISNVLQLPLTQ